MPTTRTPPPPAPPVPPVDALARLLPPEVDLATGAGLRHEAAVPVWYGMVWGRLGRGDLAWAQWDRVRLAVLQPWIAAERGRLLRELGDHRAAAALEWPALAAAEDPVDQVMLRLSLAADAVGLGDLAAARRRLAGASAQLAVIDDDPTASLIVCTQSQSGGSSSADTFTANLCDTGDPATTRVVGDLELVIIALQPNSGSVISGVTFTLPTGWTPVLLISPSTARAGVI
ncbi:MAG: hypothetical protein ACNA8R_13145, partial [Nitriliruptoraceae bacterium]